MLVNSRLKVTIQSHTSTNRSEESSTATATTTPNLKDPNCQSEETRAHLKEGKQQGIMGLMSLNAVTVATSPCSVYVGSS